MSEETLPPGWARATVDEVLAPLEDGRTLHQGWSPQCEAEPAGDNEWGVLKTTAIQAGRFEPEHNKRLPADKEPRPGIEVHVGDLVMTCAGPRSRCGVPTLVRSTRPKLMLSGKMYRFRSDHRIVEDRFLEFFLLSPDGQEQIEGMKTGISDSGLNLTRDRFFGLSVPFPPLKEQRRIVDELERRLSHVDAAEAGLRSLARRLALTQSSIENELLWRDDFERIELSTVLTDDGLANGKSVKDRSGGFPVLRLTCLRGGRIDLSQRKDGAWERDDAVRYLVQKGDFFVSRGNGSLSLVGRGGLVTEEPDDVAYPDTLIRVRVDQARMDPRFLALVWNSNAVRIQIEGVARTTAGIYKVNQQHLAAVVVPLPHLEEQVQIAAEVERRLSIIQAAARTIEQQLHRCATLRRSLLAAAFSGKLVPQNADDEPADELLARIRAEREAAAPVKRTRKATAQKAKSKKEVPA